MTGCSRRRRTSRGRKRQMLQPRLPRRRKPANYNSASIVAAPLAAPWEARRRPQPSHQAGSTMSAITLPDRVLAQVARLIAAEKQRLAGIIGDLLSSLEKVNEINVGAAPVVSWPTEIRKWSASLDQIKALVDVPAVLLAIA